MSVNANMSAIVNAIASGEKAVWYLPFVHACTQLCCKNSQGLLLCCCMDRQLVAFCRMFTKREGERTFVLYVRNCSVSKFCTCYLFFSCDGPIELCSTVVMYFDNNFVIGVFFPSSYPCICGIQ